MQSLMSWKEFINELHKSQEVPALLQSIEASASLTHPTSHTLCQALSNSWSALSTNHHQQAHPSPLLAVQRSTGDEDEAGCKQDGGVGQSPPSLFWAQVALNYTWEQLHSGHWKDVRLCWREAYALAALLKALSLCLVGKGEQALVEIDKGILLGAPIMNDSLHNVAAMLNKELTPDVMQEVGVASASDVDGTSIMHFSSEVTEDDNTRRKIGKVTLRNYKPTPDTSERKRRKPSSVSDPPLPRTCEVSRLPLIDMSRRIPVLHCPSLEEFYQHHMEGHVPVVVSGALDHWPAYAERKWR